MAVGGSTQTQIDDVYSGPDFQAIGIDHWSGSTASNVENFRFSTNPALEYPLLVDGRNLKSQYEVSGNDYSVVIDKDGIIRYSDTGVDVPEIQATIEQYLVTSLVDDAFSPSGFELFANYPNPFNPVSTIPFTLDRQQKINLKIFDARGRLVRTLINEVRAAGRYQVSWNGTDDLGKDVASGAYFIRLQGENQSKVRKMILLK